MTLAVAREHLEWIARFGQAVRQVAPDETGAAEDGDSRIRSTVGTGWDPGASELGSVLGAGG